MSLQVHDGKQTKFAEFTIRAVLWDDPPFSGRNLAAGSEATVVCTVQHVHGGAPHRR